MTDEEFIAALASVQDERVRLIAAHLHQRLLTAEAQNAMISHSFGFLRWFIPIAMAGLGILIGLQAH